MGRRKKIVKVNLNSVNEADIVKSTSIGSANNMMSKPGGREGRYWYYDSDKKIKLLEFKAGEFTLTTYDSMAEFSKAINGVDDTANEDANSADETPEETDNEEQSE